MPLKPDADAIQAHMGKLAFQLELDESRKWWPKCLFRSDHVENAARILNSGELLSRIAAKSDNLIVKDCASQRHIAEMAAEQTRYVRLYFRPRAPTQHTNEGIRPQSQIEYGAHMPVPVYLLFSSDLLMETGVRFSRGRLLQNTQVGDCARFLSDMDFKLIYHDSSVGQSGESNLRPEILNARHSEVLVQDRLSLDHVRRIVCRSAPERDTLLNLLTKKARDRWIGKIRIDQVSRLFVKRGTFLTEVNLSSRESQFMFHSNISHDWKGPFRLEIRWTGNSKCHIHEDMDFYVQTSPLSLRIPDSQPMHEHQVHVHLNGDLAYFGSYSNDNAFPDIF